MQFDALRPHSTLLHSHPASLAVKALDAAVGAAEQEAILAALAGLQELVAGVDAGSREALLTGGSLGERLGASLTTLRQRLCQHAGLWLCPGARFCSLVV